MADGAVTGRDAELLKQAERLIGNEPRSTMGVNMEYAHAGTQDWLAEVRTLVPELAGRLRLALAVAPYAVHKIRCDKVKALGVGDDLAAVDCTCGLDAALAAFEGSLPATEEGTHDG